MSGLLPCPFCGGEAIAHRIGRTWVAECVNADNKCLFSMRAAMHTKPAATAAWTRRASPWRTMETAPRDGATEVDLWVARWRDGSDLSEQAAWRMPQAYWNASMEMWCSEVAHVAVPDDCVSHWQPLPEPPEGV